MYYYICGCDVTHFVIHSLVNSTLLCVVSVSCFVSRKMIMRGGGYPCNRPSPSMILVAGVPTGRSLARCPPAVAGMAARLSSNLQLLAPALRFHLRASSRRTHAYTTQSHRTPPVGVQSQGTRTQQFTRRDAGNKTLA